MRVQLRPNTAVADAEVAPAAEFNTSAAHSPFLTTLGANSTALGDSADMASDADGDDVLLDRRKLKQLGLRAHRHKHRHGQKRHGSRAVSYTHLTLPTKRIV